MTLTKSSHYIKHAKIEVRLAMQIDDKKDITKITQNMTRCSLLTSVTFAVLKKAYLNLNAGKSNHDMTTQKNHRLYET